MALTRTLPPKLQLRLRSTRMWGSLAIVALLAAAAYAALPLWLPTSWLAGRIADQLAAALQRPVHIGGLSVSWRDGVIIRDLVVPETPGLPNTALVKVGHVRCPFQPVRTLLSGEVDELEIVDPQFWLVVDASGRLLNLPDLSGPPGGPRTQPLLTHRFRVQGLACHVLGPTGAQTLKLDRLEAMLDGSGVLRVRAGDKITHAASQPGLPPTGYFGLEAKVTVGRLRRDGQLGGTIELDWRDLALTDLPLALLPRLPIQQVEGATSGRLTLKPQPDLRMDFGLQLELASVKVLRASLPHPAQVPDANLDLNGQWDPSIDRLVLHTLGYETPALAIRSGSAEQPALILDQRSDSPFGMRLAGRIKDWQALGRELPEVHEFFAGVGAELSGPAAFTVNVGRERGQERYRVTLDAGQSRLLVSGKERQWLSARPGIVKSFEIAGQHAAGKTSRSDLHIKLGGFDLFGRFAMNFPAPDEADALAATAQVLPTVAAQLELKANELKELPLLAPALTDLGLGPCAGGATARFTVEPRSGASHVEASFDVPAGTSLMLGKAFSKGAGVPLTGRAAVDVPHTLVGAVRGLMLRIESGNARISAGSEETALEYAVARGLGAGPDAVNIEAALDVPLRVTHIEAWRELIRAWRDDPQLSQWVSGSAEGTLRTRVSGRAADWVLSNELSVGGRDLVLKVDDKLSKPAGRDLQVILAHRLQTLGEREEQSVQLAVRGPAGDLQTAMTFDSGGATDFQTASFRCRIHDLQEWLHTSPWLAELAAPCGPAGNLSIEAGELLHRDTHALRVNLDATGVDITAPENPDLHKTAGTPATLNLNLSVPVAPTPYQPRAQSEGITTRPAPAWELSGSAQLAGAELSEISGQVLASWTATRDIIAAGPASWTRERLLPVLRSATVHAAGNVSLDPALARLHPALREWRDAGRLTGQCRYDLKVSAADGKVSVGGELIADDVNARIPLNDLWPQLCKPAGLPAAARFGVDIARGPTGLAIDVREARVETAGNSAAAEGRVTIARHAEGYRFEEAALRTTASVHDCDALGRLTPEAMLKPSAGTLDAAADVRIFVGPASSRSSSPFGVVVESAVLKASDFTIAGLGEPLIVNGGVNVIGPQLSAEQFRASWGTSGVVASATLQTEGDGANGHVGLAVDHLDLVEMPDRLAKLPPALKRALGIEDASQAPSAKREDDVRNAETPTDAEGDISTFRRFDVSTFEAKRGPSLLDRLRASHLKLDASARTLRVTLPMGVAVNIDEGSTRTTAKQGVIDCGFRSLVDGGFVTGTFTTDTTAPDPTFHLEYSAEKIQPGPLVDRYLVMTFPGMKASGPLTLIDESNARLFPPAGDANWPTGRGELIIDGGVVEGRAAPVWLTKIFPGLNMASFEFSYMHSWFEKFADGRIRHQMIYKGQFYNIYMIGSSVPDGHLDYEVGIDFLADFDSKYWAESGQGRIPMFRKTGQKLPDGRLMDETVTYSTPQRVLSAIFVSNNPVVTAYHAVRKRVLKQQ